MNVLIVYAHPEPKSFNGAMLRQAMEVFREQGHAVQVTDLYAESFQAVASEQDFSKRADPEYLKFQFEQEQAYRSGTLALDIQLEQEKLTWADFVLFQFPLWWFSFPAVLKGWVDRVFTPGFVYGGGKWYSNGGLKGKRAMLALTTGGTAEMFSEFGIHGSIDSILYPIHHGILYFAGFEVLPPFVAWEPARLSEQERRDYLQQFAQRLQAWDRTEPLKFHPLSHYSDDFTLLPQHQARSMEVDELIEAIRNRDITAVKRLLQDDFPVNNKESSGRTPLMIASGLGYAEIVDCLLAAGADVHILDSVMGASALHYAAQGGSVEVAKRLLEHGAHLNLQSPTHGMTPLMTAVWHQNFAMTEYLLSQERINPKLRSTFGATARDLIEATAVLGREADEGEEDNNEWRRLFDRHEKQMEAACSHPLIQALLTREEKNEQEIAELIDRLAKETDVNKRYPVLSSGIDGHSALLVAARDGLAAALERLLQAGADMRIVDEYMHATPAHKAAYMGHADVLRVLAKSPAFAFIIDEQGPYNGYTALHDAAWHGHLEAAEVLLECGANPLLKGHDGCTALDLAVKSGNTQLADRLRQAMEQFESQRRSS